jgi:hypothetical protein
MVLILQIENIRKQSFVMQPPRVRLFKGCFSILKVFLKKGLTFVEGSGSKNVIMDNKSDSNLFRAIKGGIGVSGIGIIIIIEERIKLP